MAVPSGIIIAWVTDASIPTNWSRVTTMDDRFGKGTTGSPAPNAETVTPTHIHDSATHLHDAAHNHTGTTPGATTATGDPNCSNSCGAVGLATSHNHTFTIGTITGNSSTDDHGDWAAGSSNPAFYAVRWIQSNGSPTGFPDDSVAFFNDSTPPTGWGQHAASKDRFIIGCADGEDTTDGATGGGGTHTHATAAHTHTAGDHTHGSVGSAGQTQGAITLGLDYWSAVVQRGNITHTHTIAAFASGGSVTSSGLSSGTSGATTYEPPFYTVLGIENTSGSDSLEEGIIVGWLGTIGNIPDEWVLCDGNNDTPSLDGKFLKMADATSEVGDTGGTLGHQNSSGGHTHTSAHTHSLSAAASTTVATNGSTFVGTGGDDTALLSADNPHAHAASGTSSSSGTLASTSPTLSSTTNTEPANRTMAWLQYQPEAGGNVGIFGSNF